MASEIRSLRGCEVLPPMRGPEEAARKAKPTQDDVQGGRKAKDKRRTGQRFASLNTFVDCTLATILRTDALVWMVLFRDARGDTAKTAQSHIARRAGLCKRTVGMAIKRLERAGLLDVVHRGGLNRGLSIYRLRPLPETDDRRNILAP